jgi:erythromycin esterase-like protein
MTNEQMRRLLRAVHWYFTIDQKLTAGECSAQLETRSTLEEHRPVMYADEAAMLVETDQAIARRMADIKVVLPALPDAYMLRWYGDAHWWWRGDVPEGILD